MTSTSTLSIDGTLGTRSENTITALKEQLGVTQLEIVVLRGVDDYREHLVEAVPPTRWSWRKRVFLTTVVLVAMAVFSGFVHPGTRIDHLVKHVSVRVH